MRSVFPLIILKDERGRSNFFARKRISSSFAFPFSGGAFIRILYVSVCIPSMFSFAIFVSSVLELFGVTFTLMYCGGEVCCGFFVILF